MKDSRITFKQLKKIVAQDYVDCACGAGCTDEIIAITECQNLEDLIVVLDGMGFNGIEAYEFIIDCLVKDK